MSDELFPESEVSNLPEALPDDKAPEGRIAVAGRILSVKMYPNDFEPGTYTRKILLQLDNGSRAFCTCPTDLITAKVGDAIRITATWTRKKEDDKFSTGKIPKKAEFLKL